MGRFWMSVQSLSFSCAKSGVAQSSISSEAILKLGTNRLRERETIIIQGHATVAELADAPALGAGGANRGGSRPSGRIWPSNDGKLWRLVKDGGGCGGLPPPTSRTSNTLQNTLQHTFLR